jgi:hypothetical protein
MMLIALGCLPKLYWTRLQTLTEVEQIIGLDLPRGSQFIAAQLQHNPRGSALYGKVTIRTSQLSRFLTVHRFLLSGDDRYRFGIMNIQLPDRPSWWDPDSLAHVTAGQVLVSGNWVQVLAERGGHSGLDTVVYVVWLER